jgi:hypothetical protein
VTGELEINMQLYTAFYEAIHQYDCHEIAKLKSNQLSLALLKRSGKPKGSQRINNPDFN